MSMSSESSRSETARASCRVATRTVNSPSALGARGGRVVWRQVRRNHVDDGLHALGVGIADGVIAAADLIEQGGGGAARARIVPMTWREVVAHEFLQRRPALG